MVALKVAQKFKRILEGRKIANASQDENPIAALEPVSHRSAKNASKSAINLNMASRGGSPKETSSIKRKGYSTAKINS